jgi:hypothetical protein
MRRRRKSGPPPRLLSGQAEGGSRNSKMSTRGSSSTNMIDVGLIGFGLAGPAFHAPVIRAVPGPKTALSETGDFRKRRGFRV